MLGAKVRVRKRREVWLYRNARIHLDTVEGAGRFIEIEVVVTDKMAQARALMKELRDVLGIRSADLLAGSYGELLGGNDCAAGGWHRKRAAQATRRRG